MASSRIMALGLGGCLVGWSLMFSASAHAQYTIYTATSDGHLDAYTLGESTSSEILATFAQGLQALTVTPDGQTIYVTGAVSGATQDVESLVGICNPNGQCSTYVNKVGPLTGLAVSQDGATLYVTAQAIAGKPLDVYEAQLSACETASPESWSSSPVTVACPTVVDWITGSFKASFWPNGLALSPDGSTIFLAGSDASNTSTLEQLDLASPSELTQLSTFGHVVHGVGVSPDGATLYTASYAGDNEGHLDQYVLGQSPEGAVPIYTSSSEAWSAAVSPDNRYVYLGTGNIGSGSGNYLEQCPVPPSPGQAVACTQLDSFGSSVAGVAVGP